MAMVMAFLAKASGADNLYQINSPENQPSHFLRNTRVIPIPLFVSSPDTLIMRRMGLMFVTALVFSLPESQALNDIRLT